MKWAFYVYSTELWKPQQKLFFALYFYLTNHSHFLVVLQSSYCQHKEAQKIAAQKIATQNPHLHL